MLLCKRSGASSAFLKGGACLQQRRWKTQEHRNRWKGAVEETREERGWGAVHVESGQLSGRWGRGRELASTGT